MGLFSKWGGGGGLNSSTNYENVLKVKISKSQKHWKEEKGCMAIKTH